jgi:hypothetical protein
MKRAEQVWHFDALFAHVFTERRRAAPLAGGPGATGGGAALAA